MKLPKFDYVNPKGEVIPCHYVLFIPDYTNMQRKLKVGERTVRRLLKANEKAGLIWLLRKKGISPADQSGLQMRFPTIYAVGYWGEFHEYIARPTRFFWFNNQENRPLIEKCLKGFKSICREVR